MNHTDKIDSHSRLTLSELNSKNVKLIYSYFLSDIQDIFMKYYALGGYKVRKRYFELKGRSQFNKVIDIGVVERASIVEYACQIYSLYLLSPWAPRGEGLSRIFFLKSLSISRILTFSYLLSVQEKKEEI